MKIFQLSILFSLVFGNFLKANLPDKEKVETEPAISASVCAFIGGELGIKSKGCRGFSFSCTTLDVEIAIAETQPRRRGTIKVCFVLRSNDLMAVNFSPEGGEVANDFVIESARDVDNLLASYLGCTRISIRPGIYRAIKNADGTYTANIAVQATK